MFNQGNTSRQEEFISMSATYIIVIQGCMYAIYTVLCQLINMFGIVTNIINSICFLKQGFKDTVNINLLGLSLSDLCSLTTMAMTCIFVTPAVVASDLPFESIDVAYLISAMPHLAFTRVSSCITAMITLERCVSVVSPLKVNVILTPKRSAVAIACIFFTFTLSSAPVYVVNRLCPKISLVKNKTVIGLMFSHNKHHVEKITLLVNNVFIPLTAFVIVATGTIILTTHLSMNSTWRSKTMHTKQADRISSRNRKVANMIVRVSTLFIVCFVPSTVVMLAFAIEPGLSLNGKYSYLTLSIGGVSCIMESINSSVNIFIYHHMSSKYRVTFQKLFGMQRTGD